MSSEHHFGKMRQEGGKLANCVAPSEPHVPQTIAMPLGTGSSDGACAHRRFTCSHNGVL